MKTAEEILSKHTGQNGIYLTRGTINGSEALDAMEEYSNQMNNHFYQQNEMLKDEIRHLLGLLKDDGKIFNLPAQCEQAAVMLSLPTDSDIKRESNKYAVTNPFGKDDENEIRFISNAFYSGADWVRERIKGGNGA